MSVHFLEKCDRVWQRLHAPDYFGFVRGHQELASQQVMAIEDVLKRGHEDAIVGQYEHRLAALIGQGHGKSFLAGRMAFYTLLKVLNIGPGDEIILPAFTCAVMPNAVLRCGAIPIFADIDPDTFGSGPHDIKKKITSHTKMIVAQHSFGIPCRIEEIVRVAQEHSIFLLEDSALALDSSRDGVTVGNGGDAAFFSTDHTKPINTIVGGFLYTRNPDLFKKIEEAADAMPSLNQAHQQRLYRQFLFERRYCSPENYGRSVLASRWHSLKQRGQASVFLELDYSRHVPAKYDYPYPACMPAFLARLGLFELEGWEKEKKHRQQILKEYIQIANLLGIGENIPAAYRDMRNDIVPLRFAFSSERAPQIKKALRGFLDIDQFWFQSPVICCPEGPESLGYIAGSCPYAEKASQSIVNWPCTLSDHSGQVFLRLLKNIYGKI